MNAGERLSGRYKIIEKIGAGGMANVYLAEDLILERQVAVKMLSLDFQEDKSSYRRFQREALSTTELTHPNIVNIYDVGEGNNPYIVMEYVAGLDLKEYIIENHPISYNKIINIMDQILSGIAYAHSRGVIHRDIKPHNILIDPDEHVKITDFGIAVAISQNSITQSNSLLGSVQYISPEQARGNVVTEQSDIYSLGIVLYEMLTGSVPFEGESAVSIALKHFQAPIPSLKEFDSRIPQPLENVVLKATAKEPQQRYASVSEMRKDLQTALDPNRRDEPVFVPKDLSDEDTLVLDSTVAEVTQTINQQPPQPVADAPTEPGEEKKPKRKRRWLWFILIPLFLFMTAMFVWAAQPPEEVEIPEELIGMTYEEAIRLLEEHSLELGATNEEYNANVEEGLVFETTPNFGTAVREGSEIDLTISLGEEAYTIEDYVGDNFEEVRARLDELGFTVEQEEATHESIDPGYITAQDIEPGQDVLISETTITLTVSTGRPSFELLDLSGHTRKSVNQYVERNNLNLTTVDESSDTIPEGQVISQDPAPNTSMHAGDRVTVKFSTGPEGPNEVAFSRNVTIPYKEHYAELEPNEETIEENGEDAPEGDTPETDEEAEEPVNEPERELVANTVKIYIEDLNRDIDTVAHELSITEDREYELNFIVLEGESARYIIERDGEPIEAATVSPDVSSE